MFGCGKREIGESELPQAPQALQRFRIEQREFGIVEFDKAMDWIEDPLHSRMLSPQRTLEPRQCRSSVRSDDSQPR